MPQKIDAIKLMVRFVSLEASSPFAVHCLDHCLFPVQRSESTVTKRLKYIGYGFFLNTSKQMG